MQGDIVIVKEIVITPLGNCFEKYLATPSAKE
jgi:hypothetical protein